LIKDQM